jgi:hypothetical protein
MQGRPKAQQEEKKAEKKKSSGNCLTACWYSVFRKGQIKKNREKMQAKYANHPARKDGYVKLDM